MKHLLIALSLAVGAASLGLSADADAKRLGGGRPAGMQRQMPAKPADAPHQTTPAQAPGAQPGAQPGNAAAAGAAGAAPNAAAAAGKRSWMGPLAGLAAGIGLAALFSHLGMGAGLANVVMLVLLAVVGFALVRWVMGRMGRGAAAPGVGGLQMAGAGAGANGLAPQSMTRSAIPAPTPAPALPAASAGATALAPAATLAPSGGSASLPDGMDPAEFVRVAKQVFIRLQAANDAADVDDLRRFTTPELFAALKADLLERGNARQQTDVVQLDAAVADVAQEADRHVVSVRFSGLIREQAEGGAEPFAELWHLVRPAAGGEWAIAGITPLH